MDPIPPTTQTPAFERLRIARAKIQSLLSMRDEVALIEAEEARRAAKFQAGIEALNRSRKRVSERPDAWAASVDLMLRTRIDMLSRYLVIAAGDEADARKMRAFTERTIERLLVSADELEKRCGVVKELVVRSQ